MNEAPTDPAAILRARRHQAGFTQEQLANAAGVHVRTIRGLESGRICSPRRTSIDLITTALGLPGAEASAFAAAWGVDRTSDLLTRSIFDHTGAADADLDALAHERISTVRLSSVRESVIVDSRRRIAWRSTEEVIQALAERVTHRPVFFEPQDSTIDLNRLKLSELENCRVSSERVSKTRGVKAFVLELSVALEQMQQLLLGYAANFLPSYVRSHQSSADEAPARVGGGFLSPPQTFVLTVRFDATEVPVSCHQIYQRRPGDRPVRLAKLPLTASHAVHLAIDNPQAGGHGIEWDWPY